MTLARARCQTQQGVCCPSCLLGPMSSGGRHGSHRLSAVFWHSLGLVCICTICCFLCPCFPPILQCVCVCVCCLPQPVSKLVCCGACPCFVLLYLPRHVLAHPTSCLFCSQERLLGLMPGVARWRCDGRSDISGCFCCLLLERSVAERRTYFKKALEQLFFFFFQPTKL